MVGAVLIVIALVLFLIFGIIGINHLSTFLALVVMAVLLVAGMISGIWPRSAGRRAIISNSLP
mgnify:CR=1 FL=1